MNNIGAATMMLERNLSEVPAFVYHLTLPAHDDFDAIKLTRRGASQLSYANRMAVTDLGEYQVVSLSQLKEHSASFKEFVCSVSKEESITLRSADPFQREALKRLLNLCLMSGARELAYQYPERRLQAEYTAASLPALTHQEPSSRIKAKADYLDAYQSIIMVPEVLPDGRALVSLDVRHRLVARDGISLDWVARKRPEWLSHIKRVRHRYATQGRYNTAELKGLTDTAVREHTFRCKHGDVNLIEYHEKEGNIPEMERELSRNSHVVRVAYGRNAAVNHLACLLQPMFDFETLQKIDSPFLNNLAKNIKWPIMDRLKAVGAATSGLIAGELGCRLVRINAGDMFKNVCPPFRLRFRNKIGNNERRVLDDGAFQGMTRKFVCKVVVGSEHEMTAAQVHFDAVRAITSSWVSPDEEPRWYSPVTVANALELDQRLQVASPKDAILLIGLGKGADKQAVRDVAFRHGLATQFFRLDHPSRIYTDSYYGNLAAGMFSKGGGLLCALDNVPGDTDLFIGLDMGGVSQRAPGTAFLFTRDGAQLGWQLAETQRGERMEDRVLRELLDRSLQSYLRSSGGELPRRITLHRDGRLFESLGAIQAFERDSGVAVDVLEVIKSGSPPLGRRFPGKDGGKPTWQNPAVGDAMILPGLDEMILSTYGGNELGAWGQTVTVRPLRLRKRYGETSLEVMAQQVLLLSRIHGASLYRHPRLPVTTHHADRFATLRQQCNLDDLSKMDRMCPVYL